MVEAPSQPTAGRGSWGAGLLGCRTAEATTVLLSCRLPSALPARLTPPATSRGCSVCPSQCKHCPAGNILVYPKKTPNQAAKTTTNPQTIPALLLIFKITDLSLLLIHISRSLFSLSRLSDVSYQRMTPG